MKITIAIASRNFFGAERRVLKIVHALATRYRAAADVRMIVNSSLLVAARRTEWGSAYFRDLDSAGRLVVVPDRIGHLRYTRRLIHGARALMSRAPFHAVLRAEPLASARALLGLPSSIEITGPVSAKSRSQHLPLFLLRRLTSVRLLTPSLARTFRAGLTERFGARISDEVMARAAVASSPYFVPSSKPHELPSKEKLIVSGSRFERRKNVVTVAKALAIALPKLPAWNARVMGQGEDDAEIRSILQPFIEAGRVTVGYEPHIEEVLKRSQIYVSLIEPDNYPSQAVLEAMQFGNALVLSDVGDSAKFIGNPPNGELAPIDAQEVAKRIVNLANEGGLAKRMGELSMKHVREAFDARTHIAELLAIHGVKLNETI